MTRTTPHRFASILSAGLFVVACGLLAPSSVCADDSVPPPRSPLSSVPADAISKALPEITGQVKRVAIGSTGATITMSAGNEVEIDLSGLTGAQGGTNYLGLGMLLFGLSVAARLLTSLSRITRPFARARIRRERE